jgi:hypothetical protein
MSSMIQSLESRVLFSSVATIVGDGAQLVTDIQSARANVIHYENTLATDVRTVAADVRSVPASTQRQTLLRAIRTDETKWADTIRADIRSVVTVATANKTATVAAAIRVFHHPTNLTYIAELVADIAKIGSALDAPITKLGSDVTAGRTALVSDLNNLASAYPSDSALQSGVQQITSDSQSAITQLTSDGQTIATDLQTLGQTLGG